MPPEAKPPARKPAPGAPPPIWDVPYDVAGERAIAGYLPDGRAVYSRTSELDDIDEALEDAKARGLSPEPIAKPVPVTSLDDDQRWARHVIDRAVALTEAAADTSASDAYGSVVLRGDQVTMLDDPGDPTQLDGGLTGTIFTVVEIAGPNLVLTQYGSQRSARPPFAALAARCARLN